MEKKGTSRQKRRPKGDPNPQKGPLGDPGILKGTQMGTVLGQWRGLCPHSFCSSVGVLCSARRSVQKNEGRKFVIQDHLGHCGPLCALVPGLVDFYCSLSRDIWVIFCRTGKKAVSCPFFKLKVERLCDQT